jgi:hypothetical protein
MLPVQHARIPFHGNAMSRNSTTLSHDHTVDDSPEAIALARTRARIALRLHATVYAVVNTGLVAIWLFSPAKRFWPGFVMAGWGIALAIQTVALRGLSRGSQTWTRIHAEELARARSEASR